MSFNFNSGQFNRNSSPRRLGNWQVPRWAPTKPRPVEMRPNPKPICDINGHFLPGAPKGTSRCFGHFTGTWDLPRKITRKVAEELAKEPPNGRFPDWINLRVQRPKAGTRLRTGSRGKAKAGSGDPGGAPDDQTFQEHYPDQLERESLIDLEEQNTERTEKNEDPLEINIKQKPVDKTGHGPYIPGSLTDTDNRHETYDHLIKDAVEKIHGPQEDESDKFWRKVAENAKNKELRDEENMKLKKSETPKLPSVNASQNFNFAKKMHVGNLEHQPLPDTLGYRHMTKIGEHRDSDIIVKPYAIGWKGFGASGPTCCTKLRVHRPKTCDPNKTEKEDNKLRPSTSASDLGGQYKKPMSLMDLAICWDFRPENPKSEPRPPKHIDGSRGSKAPAVFTMVQTPKDDIEDLVRTAHSNPIFNQNRVLEDIRSNPVPYFEKDMTKERRKDSCDVQHCPQHNGDKGTKNRSLSSRSSSNGGKKKDQCDGIHGCGTPSEISRKSGHDGRPDKLQPIKDAWECTKTKNSQYDVNQNRHSLESYEKTPLAQGKLHQSSPNESQLLRSCKNSDSTTTKHKSCISCNGTKIPQELKQKEDYKLAFKAGNPNSVQSVSSTDSKVVKMPKMRHPYTKKSYTIPTLVPPFTIWRDANATGYPEHWRLASVYQHAFKPPEQRRKPLISSVYQ